MDMTAIIIAAGIVGAVGILAGILLGVASEKFKVVVDETEVKVRECLPGNNCGACGFPGCDGLAAAIAAGTAPANACPVGGAPVAAKSTRFHIPFSMAGRMCAASTDAQQPQPDPPLFTPCVLRS